MKSEMESNFPKITQLVGRGMVQIQHPYTHTLLTAMHPALLSLERKKRLYKQSINTAHLYNGSIWKVLRTAPIHAQCPLNFIITILLGQIRCRKTGVSLRNRTCFSN